MLFTTLSKLKASNACKSGYKTLVTHLGGVRKWGKETPIPLSEIVEINGIDDTFWVISNACDLDDLTAKRIIVAVACDFAERVLPIFEAARPNDGRPRAAIAAAMAAAGAGGAAWAAAAAGNAAWAAAGAARAAAWAAAAAGTAAWASAGAGTAARAAAEAARGAAIVSAEEAAWQKSHLIDILERI